MLKKRNLIFICLLILGVFLITSCLPKPPVTEGILKGQVIVPEGSVQAKDLTGQALANAVVNIIDPVTGDIIATTVTDANGYYQVFVPAGGPYLLKVIKDGVVVLQITPQVEVGIEYDLGIADCNTTAVALIALAMMDAGANLGDIDLADIEADPNFNNVVSSVTSIIEAGGDPTESAAIQQAVEDFLSPPAPPPPDSTPTYTVTYDGNGSTGGTVPSDTNNYEEGDSVTVLGNTGNLEKTQDGISFLFTGWNTAADGSGTDYKEADTFNMGTANVTLYAKWSAIGTTGPAGGLIFYDKGSVSDGWRYLEAAPVSTESKNKQWGINGTLIGGTETGIGTGKSNTEKIIDTQGTGSTYAAQLCDALVYGTYSDWFLPSKDELNLMYENLYLNSLGDFADSDLDFYWSSSERSADFTWAHLFYDNTQDYYIKSHLKWVRAARAFRSTESTYIVNYNANGATEGTVPSDVYHYEPGETVIVLGNTGTLVKTGYTFAGWNTQADGNGTPRAEGSTFNMGASNVTLYAKWTGSLDRYVSTSGNNGNDGSAANRWLTIQYALNNTPDGGTIHVADGTYTENISFPSAKVIVLKSENGASSTEINGGNISRVVTIDGCPDSTTLDGFTITGGNGSFGGGVYIYNCSPVIQNNTISENTALYDSGGISIIGGSPTIQYNTISENTASNSGGGIYIHNCSPTIEYNTITGNTATRGGGIYMHNSSSSIEDNTISGNTATGWGGGIYISGGSPGPDILYNTISVNTANTEGGGIYIINCSPNIQGNTICSNTLAQIYDDSSYSYPNNDISTHCDIIGQTGPAGGLVFYDKGYVSDGWRYLEAAPLSTECSGIEWGSCGTLIGGTETGIGTGQSNTEEIIDTQGTGSTYAAQLCDALTEGGYDDWFLPSKDELNLMYTNLHLNSLGDFAVDYYWSSSENNADTAWHQDFLNGGKYYDFKSITARVRAVRAF